MADARSILQIAQRCAETMLTMVQDTASQIESNYGPSDPSKLFQGLLRVGQTLDSARVLSGLFRFEDVWVLTRVLSEAAINTAYLSVASDQERQRWLAYEEFTQLRWIKQMQNIPQVNQMIPEEQSAAISEALDRIKADGLFDKARSGSWSENGLIDRAMLADTALGTKLNIFPLLYQWAVKQGDAFIHTSSRALSSQTLPIKGQMVSEMRIWITCQGLAVACSGCYALVNFARVRNSLEEHPASALFGSDLETVFSETRRRLPAFYS